MQDSEKKNADEADTTAEKEKSTSKKSKDAEKDNPGSLVDSSAAKKSDAKKSQETSKPTRKKTTSTAANEESITAEKAVEESESRDASSDTVLRNGTSNSETKRAAASRKSGSKSSTAKKGSPQGDEEKSSTPSAPGPKADKALANTENTIFTEADDISSETNELSAASEAVFEAGVTDDFADESDKSNTEELTNGEGICETSNPLSNIPSEEESADSVIPQAHSISFFEDTDTDTTSYIAPSSEAVPEPTNTEENEAQISFFEEDDAKKTAPVLREIPKFAPKPAKSGLVKKKKVYNPDKPRGIDSAFDFIEVLIISVVFVLILTSFVFKHSKVNGESMEGTLYDGDHLIISDFLYTPQRGDIIVFKDTEKTGHAEPLVKRVIAVAGDHVQVDIMGHVTLNGVPLEEDYYYIDGPIFAEEKDIVVPEGEIFVMGDHRNKSHDSRAFDTVKVDTVIGRVLIRIYPFESFGIVK